MVDKRRGGGITIKEAEYLLDNDLDRVESELFTALPWVVDLDHVRQDVLLNMTFNMGLPTLLTFKNTLRFVRQGKYVEAAAAMLHSRWSRQVGKRAVELSEQMRLGKYL
jgi:lysozyme